MADSVQLLAVVLVPAIKAVETVPHHSAEVAVAAAVVDVIAAGPGDVTSKILFITSGA